MRLNSLMYHDVTAGPAACRYAISLHDFKRHLSSIRSLGAPSAPTKTGETLDGFSITFDDGCPGWLPAGEALAELGWKAIFFVITHPVERPTGLTNQDLRTLAAMGHVIGSHTANHTLHLSERAFPFIKEQWSRSKDFLEDVLGKPVLTASLPDGYYSETVARAADEAGLRYLFTSEPVANSWKVGACDVLGRYVVFNGISLRRAAALAGGEFAAKASQYASWNIKKALKKTMPGPYYALRAHLAVRRR